MLEDLSSCIVLQKYSASRIQTETYEASVSVAFQVLISPQRCGYSLAQLWVQSFHGRAFHCLNLFTMLTGYSHVALAGCPPHRGPPHCQEPSAGEWYGNYLSPCLQGACGYVSEIASFGHIFWWGRGDSVDFPRIRFWEEWTQDENLEGSFHSDWSSLPRDLNLVLCQLV